MPVRKARGRKSSKKKIPGEPTDIVAGVGSDTAQFPCLLTADPLDDDLEAISEKDEGSSSVDVSATSITSMDEGEAPLLLNPEVLRPQSSQARSTEQHNSEETHDLLQKSALPMDVAKSSTNTEEDNPHKATPIKETVEAQPDGFQKV
ncbi:hypothetical protein Dimus_016368 [Dionaea muscipula]